MADETRKRIPPAAYAFAALLVAVIAIVAVQVAQVKARRPAEIAAAPEAVSVSDLPPVMPKALSRPPGAPPQLGRY